MTEYRDIRCGDDLDLFARDAPPLEVLAQDIYHGLITSRFTLLQDPDWGFGLEDYIGAQLPSTLAFDIETWAKQDDRISDAACVITPLDNIGEAYKLVLTAEVERDFVKIALELNPSGIVRVAT